MPFHAGDILRVRPEEGWAPKRELRGVVAFVSAGLNKLPAYFVCADTGERFWLTVRGAADSAGMIYHVATDDETVPPPASGHGFVTVTRQEREPSTGVTHL